MFHKSIAYRLMKHIVYTMTLSMKIHAISKGRLIDGNWFVKLKLERVYNKSYQSFANNSCSFSGKIFIIFNNIFFRNSNSCHKTLQIIPSCVNTLTSKGPNIHCDPEKIISLGNSVCSKH